jgi:DNA-binding transcriptional MocR family regulator
MERANRPPIRRASASSGCARGGFTAPGLRPAATPRTSVPIQPLSQLADLLASWDDGEGPLYARLAERLRLGIRTGRLTGGTRLPPERQLAAHLGVARNTVVRAYAELEAAALLTRRQGSGTVVSASTAAFSSQPAELSSLIQRNVVVRLVAEPSEVAVDFLGAHALPDSPVNDTIREAISNLAPWEALRQPGYFPLGYPPLRAAIASHLTRRGIPTVEDQILVTSGAQQAIALIATGLVRGKKNVLVEDPTFPGAIDSFRVAGARLLTVPVTDEGPDLDRLSAILDDSEIALAYLIPTHQNPTGVLMPIAARQELARLCEATGLVLVEDDALAELGLSGSAPPPIAALTRTGIVLSIGSLSKLFWGGLRIGWIRGPREMIAHLGQVKATDDLGTSVVSQVIAVRLLEQTDAVRERRQIEVTDALARLEALLRDHLPSWSWRRPAGGLSLWARLPHGSASELARIAMRHGLAIVPGSVMSPSGAFDDHIRLPLGRDAGAMTSGIELLATAWAEYEAAHPRPEGPLRVVV